jgi:hypothetical protein
LLLFVKMSQFVVCGCMFLVKNTKFFGEFIKSEFLHVLINSGHGNII